MTPDIELKVVSEKESFVPVEASYIRDWMAFLNKKSRNITAVYVTLQLFTNRQQENVNYGKTWLSIKRLSSICDMSPPSVHKALQVLEQYNFIRKEKREGTSNLYTVLSLPDFNEIDEAVDEVADVALLDNIRNVMEDKGAIKKINGKSNLSDVNQAKDEDENVFSSFTNAMRKKALAVIGELDGKLKLTSPDLIKYFNNYYMVHYEGLRPKSDVRKKELKLVKLMIDEYGSDRIKSLIIYSVENWQSIDYANGYPNVSSVYSLRESLIPEMEAGKLKNKRGQYAGAEKEPGQW